MLEEIANLGGNIFEHDCERLPGITSCSKSFPADENFEAISGFSDVLDLVQMRSVNSATSFNCALVPTEASAYGLMRQT